jgi:hypothetical protein
MKTLMFVTALSVLSAAGAFAQGVDFSLGAPGVPPVSYTDGAGRVLDPPRVCHICQRRDIHRARQKAARSFRVEPSNPTR